MYSTDPRIGTKRLYRSITEVRTDELFFARRCRRRLVSGVPTCGEHLVAENGPVFR